MYEIYREYLEGIPAHRKDIQIIVFDGFSPTCPVLHAERRRAFLKDNIHQRAQFGSALTRFQSHECELRDGSTKTGERVGNEGNVENAVFCAPAFYEMSSEFSVCFFIVNEGLMIFDTIPYCEYENIFIKFSCETYGMGDEFVLITACNVRWSST